MKLTKALKLKNRLAGEVKFLKNRLSSQNSNLPPVPFDFDSREVLADLRAKIDQLVSVKSAIAVANAAQYARIFRLAELRGLVAQLAELDTKHGTYKEGGEYSGVTRDVEYVAQIRKADVDRIGGELQTEISRLQDELDDFNVATSVEVTL